MTSSKITFWNTFSAKTSHRQPWTHKTHHGPDSGEATTFPHIVFYASFRGTYIQMVFLSRDSQGGVPKLSRFGLPGLCEIIIFCLDLWLEWGLKQTCSSPWELSNNKITILCSDLWLEWGLKQTCSSPWELSNNVSHSTCTHRGQVDSRLLVIESQIASLTPDLSFCLNLCCKCPNGPCKPIFDICTLIAFQWYKKTLNSRCFDSCNQTLKFWES
jgi:hypothetical protein